MPHSYESPSRPLHVGSVSARDIPARARVHEPAAAEARLGTVEIEVATILEDVFESAVGPLQSDRQRRAEQSLDPHRQLVLIPAPHARVDRASEGTGSAHVGLRVANHAGVLRHADRIEVVGVEVRKVAKRQGNHRRQSVGEAAGESVDLRRAVAPGIPDHADARLPLVLETQEGPARVVAHLLSVPAKPRVDRQARRHRPGVLNVRAVVEHPGAARGVRYGRGIFGAHRKEAVGIVELAPFVSDPDELAPGVEAKNVVPAVLIVASRLDLVVALVQRKAGGVLLATRRAVVIEPDDEAVPARDRVVLRRATARPFGLAAGARLVHGSNPWGRREGVAILVIRALNSRDRARPEDVSCADAKVRPALKPLGVPCRALETHGRGHLTDSQPLAGVGPGGARAGRGVGEHGADDRGRAPEVPGQLARVEVARGVEGEKVLGRDVRG